ncbi:signal peptidase I [Dehalobacter sp. DCM]|uniref:signal peptidase I n=1 Tax=Dehalobacter sp. DCM TaxID=2907827 RepID=UPI003081AE26|nr:signal peptidase I [Dehalobacter sp. DCM]
MVFLIITVMISLLIRTNVAVAAFVPTGSMLPTIQLQDRIIVEKITYKVQDITRGDIVVFHPPEYVQAKGPDWVKRVIGLPGERVEIKNGMVYINDYPLEEDYILEKPTYDYGPIVVPAGTYFVLGDNRNESRDSHEWGVLAKENIIGRVVYTIWPIDHMGAMTQAQSLTADPIITTGN